MNLAATTAKAVPLCQLSDLIPGSGVAALYQGGQNQSGQNQGGHNKDGKQKSAPQGEQIALFYLPDNNPSLYAVSNYDPIGRANVLSRGIVGTINTRLVVASPLYKQHFDLLSGVCLEDSRYTIKVYRVHLDQQTVVLEV